MWMNIYACKQEINLRMARLGFREMKALNSSPETDLRNCQNNKITITKSRNLKEEEKRNFFFKKKKKSKDRQMRKKRHV